MLRPTPYADLNAVLHELVASARSILGRQFVGAYLIGSFAVGDFDANSDVDFMIAVERDLDAAQIAGLQAMHSRFCDHPSPWARHLEGSYMPRRLLRPYDPGRPPVPYVDNGSRAVTMSNHDNELVVFWVTRERGITLAGPEPRSLIDPVPAAAMQAEIMATMRDWGGDILANPARINTRWYQPFAVLSFARMLHSLSTGTVESKLAGARWAQRNLGQRWSGLIDRALAERDGHWLKVCQPADPADHAETLALIQAALDRLPPLQAR